MRPMSVTRQFELLEALQTGGMNRAVMLGWNGQKYSHTKEWSKVCEFLETHGDGGYTLFSNESKRRDAVSGLFQTHASWLPF